MEEAPKVEEEAAAVGNAAAPLLRLEMRQHDALIACEPFACAQHQGASDGW